jgi:hypothetical protein
MQVRSLARRPRQKRSRILPLLRHPRPHPRLQCPTALQHLRPLPGQPARPRPKGPVPLAPPVQRPDPMSHDLHRFCTISAPVFGAAFPAPLPINHLQQTPSSMVQFHPPGRGFGAPCQRASFHRQSANPVSTLSSLSAFGGEGQGEVGIQHQASSIIPPHQSNNPIIHSSAYDHRNSNTSVAHDASL